ncbi:hypothetical protein JCM3766R1_004943 [Sporobolomyces carnicolor]
MNNRFAFDYPTPEPTPSPPSIKEEESSPPSAVPTSTSLHLESPPPLALSPASLPPGVPRLDKKRTLPCERCRTIRRACKWVKREGATRASCERCFQAGKECSGPTRRAEFSTLELIPTTRTKTRRTASIGPSSPESQWSTLHMSYSLTYHLVATLDNPNPNLEFMWDIMNEKSGSLEAALEFRNEWIPRVGEFHRHAAISLAYTSSHDVLRAVTGSAFGIHHTALLQIVRALAPLPPQILRRWSAHHPQKCSA